MARQYEHWTYHCRRAAVWPENDGRDGMSIYRGKMDTGSQVNMYLKTALAFESQLDAYLGTWAANGYDESLFCERCGAQASILFHPSPSDGLGGVLLQLQHCYDDSERRWYYFRRRPVVRCEFRFGRLSLAGDDRRHPGGLHR